MVNCMTMTGTRLTTTAEPQAGATIWEIDPAHSLIELSVKHMMFDRPRAVQEVARHDSLPGRVGPHQGFS